MLFGFDYAKITNIFECIAFWLCQDVFERKFHFMSIAQLVLTIIVVITSLFLICVVLLQSGKSTGVAGALSGSSDTFLSNHKKNTWDARLARITKWISFVFMAAVLVLNLI